MAKSSLPDSSQLRDACLRMHSRRHRLDQRRWIVITLERTHANGVTVLDLGKNLRLDRVEVGGIEQTGFCDALAEARQGIVAPRLGQFLGQALDLMAANRGLVDVLTNDYGAEWFSQQLHDLITGPIRHLVSRGQQAGCVRPDVDATDFAVILPMLASVSDRGVVACVPEPTRRYLALVLAGLRPDGTPLPGRPPTDAELRAAVAHKTRAPREPKGAPLSSD